jgi:hypothetical protein
MKKLALILTALLMNVYSYAQANQNTESKSFWKSLWGSVETSYGWIPRDKGKYSDIKSQKIFDMTMRSLHAKAGYYFTPRFSLGAGIGLRRYTSMNLNTLPIFADIRYHAGFLPKLYAYADIGASIGGDNSAFTRGFLSNIGIAYKIRTGKRTSLNPSVGYNLFLYSIEWPEYVFSPIAFPNGVNETKVNHSIFLQLGFQF